MRLRRCVPVLTLAVVAVAAPPAPAELLTYDFAGHVTVVENKLGFLSDAAVVGAAVSGSFTFTTTPNQGAFELSRGITTYVHQGVPPDTGLVMRVGGDEARSNGSDLTIMAVGNDNAADTDPPITPLGDSFRYDDAMDPAGTLFAPGHADQFHFSRAILFLIDPSGAALSSQALPAPLPVSAFGDKTGLLYVSNDDDVTLGSVTFAIDAVGQVPEPAAAGVLLVGGIVAMSQRRRRSAIERK